MSVFKIKKRHIIISGSIFGGLAAFCLVSFILSKKVHFIFLGFISSALLCLFALLSKTTIITTEKVIRKSDFKSIKECNWEMIYSVSTFRMASSGNYSTTINWAKEPQYRNKIRGIFDSSLTSGAIDVSDHFEGYVDLLKEVKLKAVNAVIDQATIKIIAETK